jgi:hypothetical protein
VPVATYVQEVVRPIADAAKAVDNYNSTSHEILALLRLEFDVTIFLEG